MKWTTLVKILVLLVLLALALPAIIFVRVISAGGDKVSTEITLTSELKGKQREAFQQFMVSDLQAVCKNVDELGGCRRWVVGEGAGGVVLVGLVDRDNMYKVTAFSVPSYFLYLGPAMVSREHKVVEGALLKQLDGSIASVTTKVR